MRACPPKKTPALVLAIRGCTVILIALLLLRGCAAYRGSEATPTASSADALEAALIRDIPVILICASLERLTFSETVPNFDFSILNGTLLAWSLNGQALPHRRGWFAGPHAPMAGLPYYLDQRHAERFTSNRLSNLIEGENEFIIWAEGRTGLVVERRLSITSDQTTPMALRRTPILYFDASLRFDIEDPTTVIIVLTGRFNELLVFAHANNPYEPLDIKHIDDHTIEVATTWRAYDSFALQTITIQGENQWGVDRGTIRIFRSDDGRPQIGR